MSTFVTDPTEIWEPTDEPDWLKISWKYADLEKATQALSMDINRYKAALMELDDAGTSIGFGRERIAQLRADIAEMEATK